MINCLGVVLAGGKSSRMGEDKSQLSLGDQSLIARSMQLLHDSNVDKVIVSGNEQLPDLRANLGPVGGIYTAIQHYQPTSLLVLPVDMPLITQQSLEKLKNVGQLTQQACFYQQSSLPLYLPVNGYLALFLQKMMTTASSKGPSIQNLLKVVPHKSLTIANNKELLNANTPEQWQEVKQYFSK